MTLNRKEYELVYDALKNYHVYMDKDQRLLAEQILDDLYYPREVEDRLDTDKTGQDFREELDVFDAHLLKDGQVPTNINTQNALRANYEKLIKVKQDYADKIGVEFKMVEDVGKCRVQSNAKLLNLFI